MPKVYLREDAVIKTTKSELAQIYRDGWVEQAIRFVWRLIFRFPKLHCFVLSSSEFT